MWSAGQALVRRLRLYSDVLVMVRCLHHWSDVCTTDQMSAPLIRCLHHWPDVCTTDRMSAPLTRCLSHWLNVCAADQIVSQWSDALATDQMSKPLGKCLSHSSDVWAPGQMSQATRFLSHQTDYDPLVRWFDHWCPSHWSDAWTMGLILCPKLDYETLVRCPKPLVRFWATGLISATGQILSHWSDKCHWSDSELLPRSLVTGQTAARCRPADLVECSDLTERH